MIVLAITALLLVLILLRVPIAFAILIAGLAGMVAVDGLSGAYAVVQVIPITASGKYSLAAIPLFILMAHFVLASGALSSLFESARVLVGRVRGGTGIAAVLAGAVLDDAEAGAGTAATDATEAGAGSATDRPGR